MTKINTTASEKGPYEIALKVMRRKRPDLVQANALLGQAHAQGDRRATYALATWSLSGNAVRLKDLREAVKLLKLAAKADIAAIDCKRAIAHEL